MYVVTILTQRDNEIVYKGLTGTFAEVNNEGRELFRAEHPGEAIKDSFALPESDYYNAHKCKDSTGAGCCEFCGGVISGSLLYLELNGGD